MGASMAKLSENRNSSPIFPIFPNSTNSKNLFVSAFFILNHRQYDIVIVNKSISKGNICETKLIKSNEESIIIINIDICVHIYDRFIDPLSLLQIIRNPLSLKHGSRINVY